MFLLKTDGKLISFQSELTEHQLLNHGEDFREYIVDFQYSVVILCLHVFVQ